MFPDSSHYKKYNGSCFIYLSEILSKLHMFKVTNFMTFSDGLLIYVILHINHTHLICFYFPLVISANLKCNCAYFMYEMLRKLQFDEISN